MRPAKTTPAHKSSDLAELVCSNSLKNSSEDTPAGLLKKELETLGSLLLTAAVVSKVPAGNALAVDRERFARYVTKAIENEPAVTVIREELSAPPSGYEKVIIATGPLTSEPMANWLADKLGEESLYFYDAIAPVVETDSIDMSIAFYGDRYGESGKGDYLNIPLDEGQYKKFVADILAGEQVAWHDFEKPKYFDACLPIEEIARRGEQSLAFGPLKPVGFTDPSTGRRPYAIIQLRKENLDGSAMNMVGFQTKLTYGEQKRIFVALPAMADAKFLRYGSLHRNTYINAPASLAENLSLKIDKDVFMAGQMTGVEGYVESIAIGWLSALFVLDDIAPPPAETCLGALLAHLKGEGGKEYQPTNMNYSLFPPIEKVKGGRKGRRKALLVRAEKSFDEWKTKNLPTLPEPF
jgi:methylenetetrahydrofolate--tRNA-(uracil-5-)-methyltransferase